jgi:hypothetical protein
MNHSDIKMTMRYAKLAPDSGKNEVKGLYKWRLMMSLWIIIL